MSRRWLDPSLLLVCVLALLLGGLSYAAQQPTWAVLAWAAGSALMVVVLVVEMAQRLAKGEAGIDLIALLSIGAALALEQLLRWPGGPVAMCSGCWPCWWSPHLAR